MRKMFSEKQIKSMIVETSETTKIKNFSNIQDSQGHDRFIEGDINILDSVTNISKVYGKWSLSGSHLLMVLVISVSNGETISGYISNIDLPQWIKDKIVPLFQNRVVVSSGYLWSEAFSTQNLNYSLAKNDSELQIYLTSVTLTDDRVARIQFDILIDND